MAHVSSPRVIMNSRWISISAKRRIKASLETTSKLMSENLFPSILHASMCFLLMFQLDAWYPPIEATSCSNILTFLAPGELRYVLWCGFPWVLPGSLPGLDDLDDLGVHPWLRKPPILSVLKKGQLSWWEMMGDDGRRNMNTSMTVVKKTYSEPKPWLNHGSSHQSPAPGVITPVVTWALKAWLTLKGSWASLGAPSLGALGLPRSARIRAAVKKSRSTWKGIQTKTLDLPWTKCFIMNHHVSSL